MGRQQEGPGLPSGVQADAMLTPDQLLALIERAKRREEQALTELVTRYHRQVYLTAHAILHSPEDAEDVAQEAFMRALAKLHTLERPEAFASWLTTITTRLAIDKTRQHTRSNKEPWTLTETSDRLVEASSDPADRVILAEALASLSPAHRATLLLYERDGYDYKEIAQMLRIPIGTVKSRLANAKRALREAFASREDDT